MMTMMRNVAQVVLGFRDYMIFAAVTGLFIAGIHELAVRRFRWNKRRIRIFGLLFSISDKGLVQLGLLFLRFLFVMYALLFFREIGRAEIVYLAVLGVATGILEQRIEGVFMEVLNTGLLIAGLLAGNLLTSYMKEIQFEWGILAVYGLLGLFSTLYCFYFTLRSVKRISEERRESDVVV